MPRHFSIRSADNLNKIPKAIEKISPFHRYWANAIFVSPLGRCLHILARHCCPSSNVLSIRRQSQTKSINEKSKGIRDHAAPRRYIGTCHNTPISHTLLSPCGRFSCSSRRLEGAAVLMTKAVVLPCRPYLPLAGRYRYVQISLGVNLGHPAQSHPGSVPTASLDLRLGSHQLGEAPRITRSGLVILRYLFAPQSAV